MDDGRRGERQFRTFVIFVAQQRCSQVLGTQEQRAQEHGAEERCSQNGCQAVYGITRQVIVRWREPRLDSAEAGSQALKREAFDERIQVAA